MTLNVDQIEREALKLAPDSRARLAESLLTSLETLSDAENEALWAKEALRGDRELDTDEGQTRPAEEVFREARAVLHP